MREKAYRGLVSAAIAGVAVVTAPGAARAADVLMQRNDVARSGVNSGETTLTPAKVSPETFGRLWNVYADSHIIAQPLYVSKLAVDTSGNPATPPMQGTFNTLIVSTMHNTVYAYDADNENRLPDGKTKPLWATWLGPPRAGGGDIDQYAINDPEWGITSTPVIDPQKTTIWVLAWHTVNNTDVYKLHKLRLKDGKELAAAQVGGPPPDPHKPCDYPDGFNPCKQKQRPGLLLLNGAVYVAFGGDNNRGNVVAFDADTLQQKAFWSSTPSGKSGGIWQSGHGLAADSAGNVYLMTGNGTFDAAAANFGDSFVKLHLENGKLAVKDYFTPCNEKLLDGIDLDLGSAGPVLLPNSDRLIGGGKQGIIYVVSRANMGKFQAGTSPVAMDCKNANIPQQIQACLPGVEDGKADYGNIHSAPIYFKAVDKERVYVWGELNRLRAFQFQGGKFTNDAPKQSAFKQPDGMPGGMLGVSSNGKKNGIVWAIVPLNGDANKFRGVTGIVVAVDAQDVSKQLWTSELAGTRDRLGLFSSFVPPTIAGGKVFVATHGDAEPLAQYSAQNRPKQMAANHYVTVYGLLSQATPKPVINQDSDDTTVVKAATTALTLDPSKCVTADGGTRDCTAALSAAAGAPAFQALVVPAAFNFAGCKLLRVTTASKPGAIHDTTGVGWYAADSTAGSLSADEGRLVAHSKLKQVGTAQFKNGGGQALLHEFAGVANCPAGGGATVDKLFKPYMQFDNAPQGLFHNWDRSGNYRISQAAPAFDRSGEVLAP